MDVLKTGVLVGYFLLADFLWITFAAQGLYAARLGPILQMATGTKLLVGLVVVYALLLLGLFAFVLVDQGSLLSAALFGFVVYGVYGWTNWLIIGAWSMDLVFADWLWGGFLYASTTYIARLVNYFPQ